VSPDLLKDAVAQPLLRVVPPAAPTVTSYGVFSEIGDAPHVPIPTPI